MLNNETMIAAPKVETPVGDDDKDAPEKGDYVLATKWNDGDPFDHWCVGIYDRLDGKRHHVLDSEGRELRLNGFRRCNVIEEDYGCFLLQNATRISPEFTNQQIIGSLWDSEKSIRNALRKSEQYEAPPVSVQDTGWQSMEQIQIEIRGAKLSDNGECYSDDVVEYLYKKGMLKNVE